MRTYTCSLLQAAVLSLLAVAVGFSHQSSDAVAYPRPDDEPVVWGDRYQNINNSLNVEYQKSNDTLVVLNDHHQNLNNSVGDQNKPNNTVKDYHQNISISITVEDQKKSNETLAYDEEWSQYANIDDYSLVKYLLI